MAEEYTPLVDFPDYTREFAISAVLVDMIPVTIKAQTIDKIRIDIVAQSIGNIAVDIAAQTVGNITVDIAAQSVGNLAVDIKAATATVNVNIAGQVDNVAVDIAAQTLSTLKIDIAAQTLSQVDVNIAAQAVTLNVSVQGTANVNITDAIINISALKLMDEGAIRRLAGFVNNGYVTLYTVPSGKKLYLFSVQLNVEYYDAGVQSGEIDLYDGANLYPLIVLAGPDGVNQMNDSLSFTIVSIPAGWEIRVYGGAHSTAHGCCMAVEVNA